jgi:hypothetical protein
VPNPACNPKIPNTRHPGTRRPHTNGSKINAANTDRHPRMTKIGKCPAKTFKITTFAPTITMDRANAAYAVIIDGGSRKAKGRCPLDPR